MDQPESDLSSQLASVEPKLGIEEPATGETPDPYEWIESAPILSSSPTEAEFGDSSSDRAEEMAIEDSCDINWEEDTNFSPPCESALGVIALTSGTDFDDIPVAPPSESPTFNTDLENLFNLDLQADVLNKDIEKNILGPTSPGVCGLCNLGNTCFMNSGLQCLLSTPTMVQFFMKQVSEENANPDSLAVHFTNLFHKVWSGKYSIVKPTEFHQALATHHSQFRDYRQHDCQEFLALVLGTLHELLNTASSKSHVSDLSAEPMTPHSTFDEDRESSGARTAVHEPTDHDSTFQMALSITGLRCEASSSSHSSESSIGASQIRMRPLPEDVQPFKSFQSGNSILWETMDSISENTDMSPPAYSDCQFDEATNSIADESRNNIISDNILKKETVLISDKSRLEKNEVALLNNIPQCFRGYEDILKDAKTSNVNVLVTEQGANNEIVFDSDKFPKHESIRRREALENPNLTEFHNFDGKTVSVKRIKETNKLHDNSTENTKDYLALETFYNSNNKRFKGGMDEVKFLLSSNKFSSVPVSASSSFGPLKPAKPRSKSSNSIKSKISSSPISSNISRVMKTFTASNISVILKNSSAPPSSDLEENLEREKNYRMEYERKLCDEGNRIDHSDRDNGEFSGATALNAPINVDDDLEADKQWEKHLGHNQSVIVDSFQGQFKSTVVCSECRYVSSTYEPFMYLSVPLPHAMEQQICVTFVPANSNPPTKFLLTLNKQDKLIKIKEHLRKVMKANVSMPLELAEVLHHHIARILDDNLFIRYLGTSDPHRSIYAFEISDEVICSTHLSSLMSSSSSRETCDGCHTDAAEPLDLTPEQAPAFNMADSSVKTVLLNNVETRRISKQCEPEAKSNISSTINNNLKACSDSCMDNSYEPRDAEVLEYGPYLEYQGAGDASTPGRNRIELSPSNENNDWKSCAICLEEVEKGLKNHKGCSCFLCDNCIERSVRHYNDGDDKGFMKCPVCNDVVDPKRAFVVTDELGELKSSVRMLKVPVLFRQDIEEEGNNNEECQKLFGHPHLIKVANRLKGSELYEVVGKLVPYDNCYSIVLVDGQGYHCSRCMYTVHCKGCRISEDTEISLQTGDNLAVRFTSTVVEIPAVEHHSLKAYRQEEELSLYDCLDAFSESETLDEHNPWYCPTCQRNQCATKTLSVWRYPDFLIVYLKRFVFHEYTSVKLDNKVSFPLTGLNLVPPSRIQQGTTRPYNLYACVNHFGGASAGHYTAYAKNPQSGDWHLFNDDTVTAQKPQEEDFCNAYVLFYQKQGVSFNRNLPNSFLNGTPVKPNIEQLILDLDSSVEQDSWHENITGTPES